MELSDITVVVRPRNHWEAIDLGGHMVRRWWRPLYLSWLTVTLPVFLGLYVVLHAHATIAVLIFWWLKPAYERLPLLIVSQALFGATPSVRTALREYVKLLPKQLFRTLTVRRFVPTRSLDQPVSQLENLAGAERHRRLELLRRTAGSPAFWLTFVGVHVEMFLTLGLLLLVFELIPGEFDLNLWESFVSQGSGQLEWLSNALYFCAVSLVGPIYAVSGFSLYINRRIELEGWDIELEFRRLMRRVGASLPRLAVALVFLIVCSPDELSAAEQATDATGSKALIEEIMEGPEFNEERVTRVPKALRDWFEEDDSETPASTNADWVVDLVRILAQSVEFALWVIVVSFLIWIVYRYRGWLRQFLERSRSPGDDHERPSVMFGLNVEGRALPSDPIRSAEELWASKRYRDAVSLLYRAALVTLMDRHQCRFRESDTEGQCVEHARSQASAETADRFRRLTLLWQAIAYAHRVPTDASFKDICDTWSMDLTTHP